MVYVESGTKYGGCFLSITTAGSITPGTTAHDWKLAFPKIKTGTNTITDAGGNADITGTITHGLGTTPTRVVGNLNGGQFQTNVNTGTYTSTNFTAYAYRTDGASISTAEIAWIAVYEE